MDPLQSHKAIFWHSTPSSLPGQLGVGTKLELRFTDRTGCTAAMIEAIRLARARTDNLSKTLEYDGSGLMGFLHRFRYRRARAKLERLKNLARKRMLDILLYSPVGADENVLVLKEDWVPVHASERRQIARKAREAHKFYIYTS